MIKFVIYKTLVKGRKIVGSERVGEIEGTWEQCNQYCVANNFGYMLNERLMPNPRFDIRTA